MLWHMKKYACTIQYKPGKEMVLADHLSHFAFHRESLPIPIAQNIQHIQLSNAKLDVIRGSVEHDLMNSTIYQPTLRGWLDHRQQVPRITRHFWGAWDELSIEVSFLLKGTGVCIPLELLYHTLADLHGTH